MAMRFSLLRPLILAILCTSHLAAQVHYHENGQPWKQRASRGPDSVVDGW